MLCPKTFHSPQNRFWAFLEMYHVLSKVMQTNEIRTVSDLEVVCLIESPLHIWAKYFQIRLSRELTCSICLKTLKTFQTWESIWTNNCSRITPNTTYGSFKIWSQCGFESNILNLCSSTADAAKHMQVTLGFRVTLLTGPHFKKKPDLIHCQSAWLLLPATLGLPNASAWISRFLHMKWNQAPNQRTINIFRAIMLNETFTLVTLIITVRSKRMRDWLNSFA